MALSMQQEFSRGFPHSKPTPQPRGAALLRNGDEDEVLEFLSARPVHTVYMASLIRDNGLTSEFNRGSFYGCRRGNTLEGVALLGHAIVMETESEGCIKAFAELAKHHSPGHLIRGEKKQVETFWSYYAQGEGNARCFAGELLLQLKELPTTEPVPELRQATLDDLEDVVNVNAAMACSESGVNPLTRDAEGFRERAARRIGKGRIWVWVKNRRLIYKTDIIAETPEATYLEGVYVVPDQRAKGYGLRCISQLARLLLTRTKTICLTVNEKSVDSQRFYTRAGYELACRYDTIYLDD
jgi:GNAT superfamily N-acetyltransferase